MSNEAGASLPKLGGEVGIRVGNKLKESRAEQPPVHGGSEDSVSRA